MQRLFGLTLVGMCTLAMASEAGAVTLQGRIRDFCAPSTDTCTQLADFEGAIPGLVTGMVASTLTNGVPTAGPNIAAGASSAENLARWYADSPGYNLGQDFSLELTETSPGVFSYSSSSFFPIDGQLYGNQGRSHNYHFTLQLGGELSFDDPTSGPDYNFAFTGDDDLWVFVVGMLAMDLGGVHGAVSDSFSEETLKALGLVAGQTYSLDIFFAERHTSASNFNITTSLLIGPPPPQVPEPGTFVLLALGMTGIGFARRRTNG